MKIKIIQLLCVLVLFGCQKNDIDVFNGSDTNLAKLNGKWIVVNYWADWCAPCKQLDKNTFSNSQVIKYCEDNFINLRINTDTSYGYEIYNEFNIEYLPMIIFIDSNKNIVGTIEGYYGPSEYLDKIKKINNEFLSSSNEL